MTIAVRRGAATTTNWHAEGQGARVYVAREDYRETGDALVIAADLPTKGSERFSVVRFDFSVEEFELLAKTMFRANPIAAATAFGRALADGFPQDEQP